MVSLTLVARVTKAIVVAIAEPIVVSRKHEAGLRAFARLAAEAPSLDTPALLMGLIRRPFRRPARLRAYRAACRMRSVEAVLLRYLRRAGRGRPVRALLGRAVRS